MPEKVTTAPISVRPRVSFATSTAASKISRCRRIVVVIASSAARHRWKEGDLAGTGDSGVGSHVVAINRGANHFRILEGVGIFLAAARQPRHEVADGGNRGGDLDLLFRLADALAHPGKIADLHASSRVR